MNYHLFIFYRDLRLFDNTTLIEMSKSLSKSEKIIPIFLYDPKEWKSKNQFEFLVQTLQELDSTLRKYHSKLTIVNRKSLTSFIHKHKSEIQSIGWNSQYDSPRRYDFLKKSNIPIIEFEDSFLVPPNTLKHKPFRKFTPFYRHCISNYRVRKPNTYRRFKFGNLSISTKLSLKTLQKQINKNSDNFYTQGGYRNAIRQLNIAKNSLKNYGKTRNIFYIKTSFLSAYLSLNILSIRHVYTIMKPVSQDFIRELYWRDFYLYVAKYFPKVLDHGKKPSLVGKKQSQWRQWMLGRTGKPIVDACMRQMNTTGYMHNRGRMIVASYLIKDLHIPFKYGEEYFEKTLIDHNLPSNNGGWQWVNGTGIDSQPSYQKFNVLIQNKKYDPECKFIKQWIPEYKNLTPNEIFDMYNESNNL